MVMQTDEIVDIPENRLRYFGGPGKMLLPCPATIAKLIQKIPAHKLITTDLLRAALTAQFNVEGTCPITTRISLESLAHDSGDKVAYWRVIQQNGGLMSKYPGGVKQHAAHLRDEGFTIDSSGKKPRVEKFKASLMQL